MSSFYGFEIASKSLYVNQKAMNLIAHNIANANTEGYTRQRLQLESIVPSEYSMSSSAGGVQVGGGVKVAGIEQIRNGFLDTQYRRELKKQSEFDIKRSKLEYIEDVFSEPSEFGLTKTISDLFNSFEELNKNAESEQVRVMVRQNAIKMTETFKQISEKITDLQQEENMQIKNIVNEINDSAFKIRNLNEKIFNFEISGESANDLRDQRNILVDNLSSLIGVKAYETQEGTYRVDINGVSLVDHVRGSDMEVQSTKFNSYTNEFFYEAYWADGQNPVTGIQGELKGRIDIRDSTNNDNPGAVFYLEELNLLAKTIVEKFNEINTMGYTLPYGIEPSKTLINFFDAAKLNANNISISDELHENVANIAASSELVEGLLNWGNNENSIKFTELRENKGLVTDGKLIGNIEGFTNRIITEIAIDTSSIVRMTESQKVLTAHLQKQRLSLSEVSIDEEMTNMIKYQHSYAAAAKLMNVMDEMIETLIQIAR